MTNNPIPKISLTHLIDDPALGGVNNMIKNFMENFPDNITQQIYLVNPNKPNIILPKSSIYIVHFTINWRKLPFILCLKLLNKKVILIEHSYTRSFENNCVRNKKRFRLLLNKSYRLFNAVVSVSEGQAKWIKEVTGINPTVILCIPKLDEFHSIELKKEFNKPFKLGAFGRFHPQKGFDTLIDAMRNIPSEYATLDIAGYGQDREKFLEMSKDLPNVNILDTVKATEFIAQHDVIIIPSRWEAGPVLCWETRASGCPSIVSNIDGLPEQVANGSGIMVDPDNSHQLEQAILSLKNLDLQSMSKQARIETFDKFGNSIEKWVKLINSIVKH